MKIRSDSTLDEDPVATGFLAKPIILEPALACLLMSEAILMRVLSFTARVSPLLI